MLIVELNISQAPLARFRSLQALLRLIIFTAHKLLPLLILLSLLLPLEAEVGVLRLTLNLVVALVLAGQFLLVGRLLLELDMLLL
jgi:hypothetical protein